MIPVTQTMFYDPTQPVEKQRGNCLQAVIASLLELPLDEVPHFVQDDVDSGGQINWWNSMVEFLLGHGWMLHGATLETHPGEHLMVSGPSPRGQGIHHVVIYRDGEMVHDPHPDRTGLVSVGVAWGLHRLEAAAEHNPLAAAIAADPSPAEEAVKRVEALAAEWESLSVKHYARLAERIRAALASPAPAPQGEERPCALCGATDHREWAH